MLQITEDTPPDALAGAMDLAVHLPTGRSVKMAVERSTPMMDLLVQITTNHHLQLSNYTLQALGMAPSSEHSDNILPYKPNTPIGTLDTQHIKVIPKSRPLPVPKNIAPGHQPFESTFRLKVHLPRNQLYVTRVSRNVLLEDIMKKVCEEKNLDPVKYEFKHPGNLDEVLDPKLTLSDYQITEIYVVLKGTVSLNQAFSTSDIMALRKEEERKQMHTKTGGGVFNLIFRRGKSSMGSGSISSDTRSISPTHSDDSRSVTPPAVQQKLIAPPKKNPPISERPKPPQRKRRPAPKPPQQGDSSRKNSVDKPPSNISENANEVNELQSRKAENGLTICHSRNSSDSSGYHEASVLSENCNTSLPRRPKSAFVTGGDMEKMSRQHSQSTTNLSKMSSHSKSTTSLAVAGRKKKAAPPPPPTLRSSNSSIHVDQPSPVVASQPAVIQKDTHYTTQESVVTPSNNPVPLPRSKARAPPTPRSRAEVANTPSSKKVSQTNKPLKDSEVYIVAERKSSGISEIIDNTKINNECIINDIIKEKLDDIIKPEINTNEENILRNNINKELEHHNEDSVITSEGKSSHDPKLEKISSCEKSTNNLKKLDELLKANHPEQQNSNLTKALTKSMPNISQLQKAANQNIFASKEFLGEKKPPEVVAMIPKAPPKDNNGSPTKFGTFGKKRFQIVSSLTNSFDEETASLHSRKSSDSKTGTISRTSLNSALDCFNFVDEFSDLDENVFSGSKSQPKQSDDVFNQLFGMHNLEDIKIDKNQSISSLRSLSSLPGFLSNGTGMKKWSNSEDLDEISQASLEARNKWVIGDSSDAESILSTNISTTVDSLPSISSCQSTSLIAESIKASDKSFGSTDSGIAQENITERQPETELDIPITPPPPPPFYEEAKISSSTTPQNSTESELQNAATEVVAVSNAPINEPEIETVKNNITHLNITTEHKKAPENKVESVKEPTKEVPGTSELNTEIKASEISDIDWQYQLPSPPKAFRDSSPATFVNPDNCESESVTDFKDSVVTSPELFEKLKAVEDFQSEKGTTSDITSTVSEDDKPLLNTLSLENLEKRKSLVYNRELATSLKMTDTVDSGSIKTDTFSSSLTQFESTYDEIRKSSLSRETEPKYHQPNISSHTLPNFKISTYDQPKQKIKVFEDDTIRSNTDNYLKTNKVETTSVSTTISQTLTGKSTENSAVRKNSLDNHLSYSDEDKTYKFYRSAKAAPRNFGPQSCVFRSESFSNENSWSPSKPVSRSKSHLTLNAYKYREDHLITTNEDNLSRSNSLFDVSGLQSLEVMKLIQNKLNTPTSSLENLNQKERHQRVFAKPEPKPKIAAKPSVVEESQKPPPPERVYKYQGPPSINMGTWSDRPKIPVNVKEDADYKLSNHVSSKLIVKTTNNNITSNNSIEVKNNTSSTKINSTPSFRKETNVLINGYNRNGPSNVSIKVNGTEPIISTQNSGNVVIKIGSLNSPNTKQGDNQRFINHTTAAGYRKPFSNINKNQPNQRPHSVAFDSDFDISRVPVVRSVELKKPFKDMSNNNNNNNTSVTQIYQGNNNFKSHTLNRTEPVSEPKNKFSNMYRSSETLYGNINVNNHKSDPDGDPKSVFRTNSFKPMVAPVVRGFKTTNDNANLNNRLSWNSPASYNTLPSKPKEIDSYVTNKQVPFSQSNLRRTDSSKLVENSTINGNKPQDPVELNNEKNNTYNSLPSVKSDIIKPPPPPLMPKVNFKKPVPKLVESNLDPRDQLLSAIRNFGGKKGLKAVKA